jgi:hypothetical protein
MAAPTRAEIEAVVTTPTYTVEYYSAGWVALSDADVADVSGLADIGTGSSGLDFGAQAGPRGTLRLFKTATTLGLAWAGLRYRVSYGFAASDQLRRVTGVIQGRDMELDSQEIVLAGEGWDRLIKDTPIYTPLRYRRMAATPTSASSLEDADDTAYAGGLVNEILWRAGGRPLEQAATYTTAVFYYTCQPSLMGPEWSWVGGENAWSELDRLCRACGGQVVQQPDGTIAYLSPLAAAPSGYAIDGADYASAKESGRRDEYIAAARCSFAGRRLQPTQTVYEDTTPRLIESGASITITLDMERPVYDYVTRAGSSVTLPDEAIVAVDVNANAYTYPIAFATYVEKSAARAVVSLANNASVPIIVCRLVLRGRPIAVTEEGQASYGSGTPERDIADSVGVYVQDRAHAERLCRLYVDVYGQIRPARQLSGMGYDPDRTLGEVVAVTISDWSLSGVNHRISAIQSQETGSTMDLTVVPITGIPTADELFLVGETYSGGDEREVGW